MQQRIIVKVPMKKEKDRSKAMKIVVGITGVSSVKIEGEDKDIMIVIGDDIDSVTLTNALVKEFGGTTMVRVDSFMSYYQFDHQAAASIRYEGQQKYYCNYFGQAFSYYNPPQQFPKMEFRSRELNPDYIFNKFEIASATADCTWHRLGE